MQVILIHPYHASEAQARMARAVAMLRGCRCLYTDSGAKYSVGHDDTVIGRSFVIAEISSRTDLDASDYYTTTEFSS